MSECVCVLVCLCVCVPACCCMTCPLHLQCTDSYSVGPVDNGGAYVGGSLPVKRSAREPFVVGVAFHPGTLNPAPHPAPNTSTQCGVSIRVCTYLIVCS